MKKVAIVALMASSLLMAGMAEAAKPKKRTRNANRVGPYGSVMLGQSRYTGDQADDEQDLLDSIDATELPSQNLSSDTENTDIGYSASFGYRFNRYVAAELALAQFGELVSSARGDLDFDDGNGFVPVSLKLTFNVAGPIFSVVGILPLNDKFEFFGRAGLFLATSDREISSRIDGEPGGRASAKGDSTNAVFGVGAAWNLSQMYSIRAEYLRLGEVGQEDRTRTEELDQISVGLMIRF